MASNTPRSGSDKTLISGEPKDSTIFIVSSVEAPSTTSISLSGWVWRRNDSIVNAIVACELKVVVTTLIFIDCSARTSSIRIAMLCTDGKIACHLCRRQNRPIPGSASPSARRDDGGWNYGGTAL